MDTERYGEISIVTLPPLRVASYRAISPSPENDGLEFMNRWIASQNLTVPVRKFGFDIEVSPQQQAAGLRGYEQWWSVPVAVQPSAGVEIKEFPGGLYALMTLYRPFEDPFATIPAGWEKLHAWVEQNDRYQGAGHQWLEELVPGEGGASGGDDLRLYHPVREI